MKSIACADTFSYHKIIWYGRPIQVMDFDFIYDAVLVGKRIK
ncbi:hypothetical protein [Fictibacillus barbaricus]|nr:hypothetical protein [Fictibacillus barbaricus]